MRHIALVPSTALLAGAATGLLSPDLPRAFLFAVLIAAPACSVWAWWQLRSRVLVASVVATFFAGGVLLAANAWQRAWRPPLRVAFEQIARAERAQAALEGRRLPEDDEAFAVIEGTLRGDAALTESGAALSVDVDAVQASCQSNTYCEPTATAGGVNATVIGSLAGERVGEWRAGRRVRLPVQLRRPPRYLDAGVPDNERALARRGTTLVGSVKSGALVEVLGRANLIDEALGRARAFARHAIGESVSAWSERSGAVVAAIVIGDRAGLDADVQRRLQEAGTYHVIAISGGNIAILAGLLLAAFRGAGWFGRPAMLSSIVALTLYAKFVGGGASVDRATLMAVVYFAGRALDHRGAPLNALSLVAAVLVAVDPLAIADPAFLLTFGATFAILVLVPVAVHAFDVPVEQSRNLQRTPVSTVRGIAAYVFRTAASMLAASLAVEALLFPVGAEIFSRVTVAGLALNFLAIPLMGLAQIAGMAVVPLALVSKHAAAVAGWLAHIGAAGLVASAELVRFAPSSTYRVAPPPISMVAAYYVGVSFAWVLSRRRATTTGSSESAAARFCRRASLALAGGAAAWILVDPRVLLAAHGDGRLHLTMLDVGQGDAMFVAFPGGSTLLVDTGGLPAASSFDIGDRIVAPVIRAAGFRRIDYLALTHGDPDHIGGAASVIREFRPREVWEGIPVPRLEAMTHLRTSAQSAGARWANVYAGDHVGVDGVEVVAHHPRRAEWERQKVRNDDSIVLELRWREVSIVLTGDIGRAVERDVARTFAPSRLRVVKVPHHGSLTSSTVDFVGALHPQVAIVSAGRSNHFGHPVPEVLERYEAVGAQVFRTDRDGAIAVESGGYSLDVKTFGGRQAVVR